MNLQRQSALLNSKHFGKIVLFKPKVSDTVEEFLSICHIFTPFMLRCAIYYKIAQRNQLVNSIAQNFCGFIALCNFPWYNTKKKGAECDEC